MNGTNPAVGAMITNSGAITIVVNGKTYNVAKDHINYNDILFALRSKDYDSLFSLIDIGHSLSVMSFGKVIVEDGFIKHNGYIIDNSLTRRIIEMIKGKFPFEPMIKFLENILDNPSARAQNELYSFLELNTLPLTLDGHFLAYKRVRADYRDFHTGTMDNSVGKIVEEDRKLVNEDKDQTCSYGLHACSLAYLSAFHANEGHIVIVKINPRDVVSVPSDYRNTKLRCCRYEVVGEHVIDEKKDGIKDKFNKPLYNSDGSEFIAQKPDGTNFWNKRGADGKFAKKGKTAKKKSGTSILEVKPDGKAFHNKRNASGRFTRK
jgi:hypothetical protein